LSTDEAKVIFFFEYRHEKTQENRAGTILFSIPLPQKKLKRTIKTQ